MLELRNTNANRRTSPVDDLIESTIQRVRQLQSQEAASDDEPDGLVFKTEDHTAKTAPPDGDNLLDVATDTRRSFRKSIKDFLHIPIASRKHGRKHDEENLEHTLSAGNFELKKVSSSSAFVRVDGGQRRESISKSASAANFETTSPLRLNAEASSGEQQRKRSAEEAKEEAPRNTDIQIIIEDYEAEKLSQAEAEGVANPTFTLDD